MYWYVMSVRRLCILLVAWCAMFGEVVDSQLVCTSSETRVSNSSLYEDRNRTCADLIGSVPDLSNPDFVSTCKRWRGPEHPDRVNGAYVKSCYQHPDGRLQYSADLCCYGTDLRCYFALNFTKSYYIPNFPTQGCGSDQVCQTTALYPYPELIDNAYRKPYIDTQCADAATCTTQKSENGERCKHWTVDPRCVSCCSYSYCNRDTRDLRSFYVGDDVCLSNPCDNDGTCIPGNPPTSGYTCSCGPLWIGLKCNTFKDCLPNPCVNNGYCYQARAGANLTYQCSCQNGWSGDNCEIRTVQEASACSSLPCQNRGQCGHTRITYYCSCRQGWGGDNCEVAYPLCASDITFCENGGTCIDHGEYGLRCKCPPEYVGSQCELPLFTCSNPAFKHTISHTFSSIGNQNCTARILFVQTVLKYSRILTEVCRPKMVPSGQPQFINGRDGFVDELEARSYTLCERGEEYASYIDTICCPSCYSRPCQNGAWCIQGDQGAYICRCRPGWHGRNCDLKTERCTISGDPHYETFDGALIHFQGFNTYELASYKADSNHNFKVVGTNTREKPGAKVSYIESFTIDVYGYQIVLGREKVVMIDGRPSVADVDFGTFTILQNGIFVRLETDFGLVVEYDGVWTGFIIVPPALAGDIQGLCGDFDGNPDNDYRLRDGTDVTAHENRDFLVGSSWASTTAIDEDPGPVPDCADINDVINSNQYCGPLEDTSGILHTCLNDVRINSADMSNCQYDVCVNSDSETDMKKAACSAIEAFMVKCEDAGYTLSWREQTGCTLECPADMVYKEQHSACVATCRQPEPLNTCHLPNRESCVCPEGKLLYNGTCTNASECGCVDNYGNKFKIGDPWLSADCLTDFSCEVCDSCVLPVGRVAFGGKHRCGENEVCETQHPGVGVCVINTEMLTSVTTVNGDVIEGKAGSISVTLTDEYRIHTGVTGSAQATNIQLYKMVDQQSDVFLCQKTQECETTFNFSTADTGAQELWLGSVVDYGSTIVDVAVKCNVLVGSGATCLSIQIPILALFVATLLLIIPA